MARTLSIPRSLPVKAELALVIQLMLEDPNLATVKTGLQRACEQLEGGHAFIDSGFLVTALEKHLSSPDLKVRRWSYKLAGRLRDMRLLPALLECFASEEGVDDENRSWAGSAYLGVAPRRDGRNLIKKLDQQFFQTSLELGAQLFMIGEPLDAVQAMDLRAFETDGLIRKWLCILCGYATDDTRTIAKRFTDLDLVSNLVFDDDPEVIEYSIWTHHRHPKGQFKKLRRPAHELMREANVRRWLYRLVTKTEASAQSNLEIIVAAMDPKTEASVQAREGMALGLAPLRLPKLRVETAEWFAAETEMSVKLAHVEHLGLRAKTDSLARDALVAEWARLDPSVLLARKIESVLDSSQLRPIKDERERAACLLPMRPSLGTNEPRIIVHAKEVHMSNDRTIIMTGSGNTVTGINLGEMIASTISALGQTHDESVDRAAPDIERFLKALEIEKINDSEKATAIDLVKQATQPTSGEIRKSRFQTLKMVVQGLIAAPGATETFIENGKKLVETINGLLS
jgi:hypothetical protein